MYLNAYVSLFCCDKFFFKLEKITAQTHLGGEIYPSIKAIGMNICRRKIIRVTTLLHSRWKRDYMK